MFRRDPLEDPEQLIRRVGAYVAYRIGEGPEAEDVTSDVFERALRYRKSYDASRGEPNTWLIMLARELSRLDAGDQELLALRYGADLTARQIGELLDMKKNAVEVALHRALARLRTRLEMQGERAA